MSVNICDDSHLEFLKCYTVATAFRDTKASFEYLSVPRVHQRLIGVMNNLRGEFQLYHKPRDLDYSFFTINLVGA